MTLPTLTVTFPHARFTKSEIGELRRITNKSYEWAYDLMHNHDEEGEDIIRYPLIQYRSYGRKATLFGIGEGTKVLKSLLLENKLPENFKREYSIEEHQAELGLYETLSTYHIEDFLPLNSENYLKWRQLLSLADKVKLAEDILKGHLLNLCQSLGYTLDGGHLTVYLKQLDKRPSKTLEASGNKMSFLCFDTIFETNLMLPEGIGLGKGKSKGFGITRLIRRD
ncbi:hypothetical protein LAG90_09000 [Marinilongibacter aquaticus]|uniref:CRISPR-associated endonuclease Cas6 n=1 Tax=Marinilongibacter aquaticus TaxID=2975157 RepID=UPI0021BDB803|nr:CRISPR-associated endonuclease Cas6 [Marinilongibacter aquaticus]UBM60771.1 hypothetical protein LAG90_09000 [Marinilongibacter aquaticus]